MTNIVAFSKSGRNLPARYEGERKSRVGRIALRHGTIHQEKCLRIYVKSHQCAICRLAKVDALMALCNRLEANRATADEVCRRVLEALRDRASKLLRAYTAQVAALRRLRGGGAQHIRVEHIHLNDAAKAIIGTVAVQNNGEARSANK